MVRLIHIRVPQAVSACLNLASKIELDHSRLLKNRSVPLSVKAPQLESLRGHIDHYMQIANDLEGLRYTSAGQVEKLVRSNSFLKEFVIS